MTYTRPGFKKSGIVSYSYTMDGLRYTVVIGPAADVRSLVETILTNVPEAGIVSDEYDRRTGQTTVTIGYQPEGN